MKKLYIGMFTIVVVYFATFFLVTPYLHDLTLQKFAEPLFAVSPPEQTSEIISMKEVSQQIGNGDHCDYLAAVVLDTQLSKTDIKDYYENNYTGEAELRYIWLNEENQYTTNTFEPDTIFTLKDWIVNKSVQMLNGDVIIYIFESGMTSSFDYRCS